LFNAVKAWLSPAIECLSLCEKARQWVRDNPHESLELSGCIATFEQFYSEFKSRAEKMPLELGDLSGGQSANWEKRLECLYNDSILAVLFNKRLKLGICKAELSLLTQKESEMVECCRASLDKFDDPNQGELARLIDSVEEGAAKWHDCLSSFDNDYERLTPEALNSLLQVHVDRIRQLYTNREQFSPYIDRIQQLRRRERSSPYTLRPTRIASW
jgi:hypothetical protein